MACARLHARTSERRKPAWQTLPVVSVNPSASLDELHVVNLDTLEHGGKKSSSSLLLLRYYSFLIA